MRPLPAVAAALLAALALPLVGCRGAGSSEVAKADPAATRPAGPRLGTDPGGVGKGTPLVARPSRELAAFAGGCFWGTEDTFRNVPGVVATAVGYTGGHTKDPTYEEVCSHTTGHAEAVLVEYDPTKVSYEALVATFFKSHDPTTLDRQGPDVGDQYRSEVFTFSEAQAAVVRDAIAREQARRGRRVVTKVSAIGAFYKAEEYHQQYDEKTGRHSCALPVHTD
ncbi:MAG: peptide-methionine (S)-S-oxide reductase MsrA [Myxococcales bacterium]|nr:peptide-methionine (S)-S-oxide reductase MsrA [Myxococcales bacterium]